MDSLFGDYILTQRGEVELDNTFLESLSLARCIFIMAASYVYSCCFFTHKQMVQIYGINTGNQASHMCDAHTFVACLHASVHVRVSVLCCETPLNIQCETEVLTATAPADPSFVELSVCDFKAWLMDADLALCSLSVPFSIYQPRDVS